MTNEEAINYFKRSYASGDTDDERQHNEALDLAIKALEQEPCGDCISRKAVKDMLTAEWTKYMPMESDVNLSFVLEKISELPSVTPKTRWIPVSERLPEICEKDCRGNITFSEAVLSTQIYGDGYAYVGIDQYTTNNGGGWLMEVPFDNPEECCKVIAWMPLPQPYRESEDAE